MTTNHERNPAIVQTGGYDMKETDKKKLTKKQLEKVVGGVDPLIYQDPLINRFPSGMEPGYQTTPEPGGNGGFFPQYGMPGQSTIKK